jgi:hypothetical protein
VELIAGPLGPLGPLGATGYMIDKFGNYIDSHGDIARNVNPHLHLKAMSALSNHPAFIQYSVPWSFTNGQTLYRYIDLLFRGPLNKANLLCVYARV